MSFNSIRSAPKVEAGETIPEPKPCLYCGAMTAHAVLAMHGARCMRCYNAYLTARQDWPNTPMDIGKGDRLAWVKRLEYRRDVLGERLNAVQLDAMKRAKGPLLPGPSDDEVPF